MTEMRVGLRIDVDTYRGTRYGVPRLLGLLKRFETSASFFFSVGPDNMGRHLWRLARPAFLWKMLRTRAASLYGWDILLRGVFWPGPMIGARCASIIRDTEAAGHEAGLHAWDHHAWQAHLDQMSDEAIHQSIAKGVETMEGILGHPPTCSAVAGWRCNDRVLLAKSKFGFEYNSDCRGVSLFQPVVDGQVLAQAQVPVTLPTYDEVVGREGITDDNYNAYVFSQLRPDAINVLTIHAEVEGIARARLFESFLVRAAAMGVRFVPLRQLMNGTGPLKEGCIVEETLPGREGRLAVQAPEMSAPFATSPAAAHP